MAFVNSLVPHHASPTSLKELDRSTYRKTAESEVMPISRSLQPETSDHFRLKMTISICRVSMREDQAVEPA